MSERQIETESGNQSRHFFYGLQPRWLSSDRLYRIYVCDKMLSGAYVAGQIHDEQTAALMFQQVWLIFRPMARRLLAQRQEREVLYDTVDPFSRLLLDHDARNFQIWRSNVVRTRFRRNRSLWSPYNVGVVELELLDNKSMRFILVGSQQPDEILRIMQGFDPAIEVKGKPNPRLPPKPKPMSRSGWVMAAVLLLTFGILFGSAVLLNLAANPLDWHLAASSILLGFYSLAKALKMAKNQPESTDASSDS